jgi:hypothetical protein
MKIIISCLDLVKYFALLCNEFLGTDIRIGRATNGPPHCWAFLIGAGRGSHSKNLGQDSLRNSPRQTASKKNSSTGLKLGLSIAKSGPNAPLVFGSEHLTFGYLELT